ncbi:hypothetical protein ACM01_15880 [Streptomyces viridochromogenes]|uniref:Uncharacterized protein n=1 Tax=Streptomyces viridochromogenes TaxID=1938 RepID=A0A0J7ZE37_STRVR|nr:hypothetical protein [Streptomyces viridochromogenes]KMS74099.1 hypothetical protein ACM01_15880 [Streptomyces viridochromogenes]
MTDPNLPSVQLAASITRQLGQLGRLLDMAAPDEAAQILAGVLDYDSGILGEVTQLVGSGSRFAKNHSERGVLPPEVWLALGRAANELNSVGVDVHEHIGTIKQVVAPSAASSSPATPPVASAMVIRRRR